MSEPTSPGRMPEEAVVELEIHRRLRRDLNLSSSDIAEIDLPLAIEAGLIKRPKR